METVLRKAGASASIAVEEINNYFLENIKDGRKYENPSDRVEVHEGDEFVAIHAGKTPVA